VRAISAATTSLGSSGSRRSQPSATRVAADTTTVYFATNDGTIRRCPLTGCVPGGSTVLASGQGLVTDLAVDASSIFWATLGNGAANEGRIVRLAK
jgi:hypothetical protein